jgi:uncharacterized protein with PIN domain
MITEEGWERLAAIRAEYLENSTPASMNAALLVEAILELKRRLDEPPSQAETDERMKRRAEALVAAHKHVADMPTEKANSRGYTDHAAALNARVAEELRIAKFLLGSEGEGL